MTGSRPQHLLRRNGMYYLRVRVPTDLQALVGLSEVRRTLSVHILSKAKPLALKFASRVLETFVVLQQKHYSKDEARRLVQSCFIDLAGHLDHGFVPETADPEMEIAEQIHAWEEAIPDQAKAPQFYDSSHPVGNAAKSVVMKAGIAWESVSPGSQQDILSGVGRAMAEAHRIFLLRLTDSLTSFEAHDPLFRNVDVSAAIEKKLEVAEQKIEAVGPTVGMVTEHYLRTEKANWTAKTLKSRQVRIGYATHRCN